MTRGSASDPRSNGHGVSHRIPVEPRTAPVTPLGQRLRPHLALITVQILFGAWPIFGKIALRSMSATSLVACRLVGAAVIFALLRRRFTVLFHMPWRDFFLLVLCSLTGVVGNQLLYVKGLSLTTVINTALLTTSVPVFVLFVSILFGYDRLSLKRLLGIVLAAGGVVYLINPARAQLTPQTSAGNLLIACNSLLYAVYIVMSKRLFERYGALDVITWIFLVSAVLTLPLGIYSLRQDNLAAITWGTWVIIGLIIILPTVGAYYLNAWALTQVSPSTVAVYIVISKRLFERYGALDVITWIFLVSAVLMLPLGIYSLRQDNLAAITWSTWVIIGLIIILPTVGAYYLNAWALTQVSPSTVAVYIYLQPLVAFGFAPLLLGEQWNSHTGIATVLIFAGVGLVVSRGRSRAVREISEHPDALAH